jgi:ubiquinone/menaquinone biosynthesis C-methylase UbiE
MLTRIPEPELMLGTVQCEVYNQEFVYDPHILEEFLETYNQHIGITKGSIIDLGSGTCNFVIALCKIHPALSVTCYEASSAMIEIAQRNIAQAGLENQINLIQDDFFNAQGQFDLVIANRVLHHVNDTMGFWNLIDRLGKNVLVCDLGRPNTLEFLNHPFSEDAVNSLKSAYTLEEVQDQINDYNYSLVKKTLMLDLYRFIVFTKTDK